jgi:hypothetical protein
MCLSASRISKTLAVAILTALIGLTASQVAAQDEAGENAIVQLQGIVEAWLASPHADITSHAFHHWDEDGEIPATCATCHTSFGFIEYVRGAMEQAGVAPMAMPTGGTVNCAACHSEASTALVSVPFPSGVSVDTFGSSATCAVCHQGRNAGTDVVAATDGLDEDSVSEDLSFINVHYAPSAATLMGSVTGGGYEYAGRDYKGQFTHVPDFATCTSCHQPHSLEPAAAIETCAACHTGAEEFADIRTTQVDVDGDGDTSEGIANPIHTLHDQLYAAIQAYGADVAGTPIIYADQFPYFFTDTNGDGEVSDGEAAFPNRYAAWTPRLLKAAYNYQFIAKDHGAYAHNPHYALQLLYDSLEDLSGQVSVDIAALTRP